MRFTNWRYGMILLIALGLWGGNVGAQGVDLSVTKTADTNSVQVGDHVTYMVMVFNLGTNQATGVALVDVLPAGLDFVAVTSTATCTNIAGTVTCDVGNLDSNAAVLVQIEVASSLEGSITNTGTATSIETDNDPNNNSDSEVVTVGPGPQPGDVDLTGTWLTLTTKCKGDGSNCKVKGRLEISNLGTEDASSSFVRFFISDDNVFDAGDTLLKQVATGKVKPDKAKRKRLSAKVEGDPTGKFIIAVIDADNTVAESNEANNAIVFGPL